MLKIALLATAAVIAVAGPASAKINPNALNPNALTTNALHPNAIEVPNNIEMANALVPNNIEVPNTTARTGLSFGGLDGMMIIRIELPR